MAVKTRTASNGRGMSRRIASKRARRLSSKASRALDYRLLGCSDEAVGKATGRRWAEWIRILDRFNVKKHGHAAAAEHIFRGHACPGWWSQMVVVGYERHRGLRKAREQAGGFSASASRVIAARAAKVMDWFEDRRRAAKWLPRGVVVHQVSRPRSARMTWTDGVKRLSAWLSEKKDKSGGVRTTVQVQHEKIAGATECARMKKMWAERVEALKRLVEG